MTGRPFLTALLGNNALIAIEAAFGADLSDIAGTSWTWTDITADARHDPGIPVTVGRADNVSQAGAAVFSTTLNNAAGVYTPGGPSDIGVKQNTPVRERISLDGGATWKIRFQGYLDSANPATDQSAKVKGVAVTALGVLGRLGGLKKPLASALERAISGSAPSAWWPLEDPQGSTRAASAVIGVAPMTINTAGTTVPPTFGGAGPPGAAGAVDYGNNLSGMVATSIPATTATSWRFEVSVIAPAATGNIGISFKTRGDIALFNIACQGGFNVGVNITFTDGGFTSVLATGTINDGLWHRLRFDLTKSGSDTTYDLSVDGVSIDSDTLTGIAFGLPSYLQLATAHSATDFATGERQAFSHAVFWQPFSSSVDTVAANDGYNGETVSDRLVRLCAEQNIVLGHVGTSTVTMGPQTADTILNLLRECEAADHGALYDGHGLGLTYYTREARYNEATTLTVDMGANPPQVETFAPVFDRQAIKNLYAVSRSGGSTATYEKAAGTTGTATIGVEDATATINIDSDDPLLAHAQWLVGLGTVEGFRYPGIGLNLRGIPAKAANLLDLIPGSRITIKNPASKATDLPPGDIDLIVEGWTETTTASTWAIALNCSPFSPFRVLQIEDTEFGRIDTGGAHLHALIGAADTSMSVTTSDGPLWTTDPAMYPMTLDVDGEPIVATGVPVGSPFQVFPITRGIGARAHAANVPVKLWRPSVIAL